MQSALSHSKFSGKPPPTVFCHLSPACLFAQSFIFRPGFCHKSHLSISPLLPIHSGMHHSSQAIFPPQYSDEASLFSSWFSQPLINIPCSLPVSARANEQEVEGERHGVRGKGGPKDRLCQCFLHTGAIVF